MAIIYRFQFPSIATKAEKIKTKLQNFDFPGIFQRLKQDSRVFSSQRNWAHKYATLLSIDFVSLTVFETWFESLSICHFVSVDVANTLY